MDYDGYPWTADQDYEYDDNGNPQLANGQSYVIGAYNRVLEDGVYAYDYDHEGNLIQRTEIATGDYTVYHWDHRNRLVGVADYNDSDEPQQMVGYGYDPRNQLVFRVLIDSVPVGMTFFFHDQGQVALQFDKAGYGGYPQATDLSHRYLWGPAVDQLLADEQVDWSDSDADGEVLWALTDNLGSVRDLIDSNANRRVHRVFDSFGNILSEQRYGAAVDAAFSYTGRYFDADTGLQNNLNRWYNPEVGRWLSEDPIGFAGGDANLYRYVGNSPTNYTDPDGLKRRIRFFWGHGYIETVNSTGKCTFLNFGPGWFGGEGFTANDYELPTSFPISDWNETTDEQDQVLIDHWRGLEKGRRSGERWNWNPINNCWVPVIRDITVGIPKPKPGKPWSPPTDPIYTKPWWGVK